ncbi:MAG: Gfo/Idh/MocA family oxidoreductase [Candidatus Omnitrophota bacterium]
MVNKLRAAVVGCGRIGSEFDDDPKRKYVDTHIGAYYRSIETDLIAVCDLDKEKALNCAKKWGVGAVYTDLNQMLKKENIDILSICTPPQTHYQLVKHAAKFPLKAIFCEKPIAVNIYQAKQMVRLCRSKRIVLQINHQRRFDELHQELRQVVAKKKFGAVQQVSFYYSAGINNTGSHMFDLLLFLFGDAKWVQASYSVNLSHKPNDPNLDGMIKFKNGILAGFQACDSKKYLIFDLNCFLEQAQFILKNSGLSIDFYKVGESKYCSGYNELYKTKPPFHINYARNFMVNGVNQLSTCIKRKRVSISSGTDGLKALQLIESTIASAKNNGKRINLS